MADREVRKTFIEFLVAEGLVTDVALRALPPQAVGLTAERLAEMLPENGVLTEEDATRALAAFLGFPYVDLANTNFDPSVAASVSPEFARCHALVPFLRVGDEVSVAFAEVDPSVLGDLAHMLGGQTHVHIASRSQILKAIELQQFTCDLDRSAAAAGDGVAGGSAAMVELVDAVLLQALKARASDVHIEPQEHFVRVRYRVDGLLREIRRLPKRIERSLVSRLKVMADMDIAETRQPQDSRLSVTLHSFQYDFRVSTAPSLYGEKVVLRALNESGSPPSIDRMLFAETIEDGVRNLIGLPNGIVLVTGPTGSGKTTTCHALLKTLAVMDRNIVTIENPIEYKLPLATQIQVQHGIGLTFAKVFRSVLRQDPDVILVGEIRDAETARIAAEAALTGHLILSTLHTNNAVQAVVRLIELGVEPFMVAPTLSGVLAQRLVRRLCDRCRVSYTLPALALQRFECDLRAETVTLYRGSGCEYCSGTGFSGRIPIHELIVVNERMRDLILRHAAGNAIAAAARDGAYRPMRIDGLKKALAGLTTVDEVLRVTPR
jgi:type IV pilus assembly protein PilB